MHVCTNLLGLLRRIYAPLSSPRFSVPIDRRPVLSTPGKITGTPSARRRHQHGSGRQPARTRVVAIEIRETFQVQAPIDAVWKFVMDPQQVVTCMPGAALDEVVDAQTFLGTVKVKVGAITATYKGRVQFTQVDHDGHSMQMLAEGRETGGGMAKGTMAAISARCPPAQTEVVVEASVDLTGRLMQVGRGMIQGVAHQLFQQFSPRQAAPGSGRSRTGARRRGTAATAPAARSPNPRPFASCRSSCAPCGLPSAASGSGCSDGERERAGRGMSRRTCAWRSHSPESLPPRRDRYKQTFVWLGGGPLSDEPIFGSI